MLGYRQNYGPFAKSNEDDVYFGICGHPLRDLRFAGTA